MRANEPEPEPESSVPRHCPAASPEPVSLTEPAAGVPRDGPQAASSLTAVKAASHGKRPRLAGRRALRAAALAGQRFSLRLGHGRLLQPRMQESEITAMAVTESGGYCEPATPMSLSRSCQGAASHCFFHTSMAHEPRPAAVYNTNAASTFATCYWPHDDFARSVGRLPRLKLVR